MCFELNSTIKASNANLHIFRNKQELPLYLKIHGVQRVQVCLQKIHVMHMTNIFTSFQKKRNFGSVRDNRPDRSTRPVCPGRHQKQQFIIQMSITLAQIYLNKFKRVHNTEQHTLQASSPQTIAKYELLQFQSTEMVTGQTGPTDRLDQSC